MTGSQLGPRPQAPRPESNAGRAGPSFAANALARNTEAPSHFTASDVIFSFLDLSGKFSHSNRFKTTTKTGLEPCWRFLLLICLGGSFYTPLSALHSAKIFPLSRAAHRFSNGSKVLASRDRVSGWLCHICNSAGSGTKIRTVAQSIEPGSSNLMPVPIVLLCAIVIRRASHTREIPFWSICLR